MSSDALAYIDTQHKIPAVKAQVDALIQAELSSSVPTVPHPLVAADFPDVSESLFAHNPALSAALDQVLSTASSKPSIFTRSSPGIDLAAYSLPTPSDPSALSSDDWRQLVTRAATLQQHLTNQVQNLELLGVYGANAWRYHLMQVEAEVQRLEQVAKELEKRVADVNEQRKVTQESAGQQLERASIELLRTRTSNLRAVVTVAHMEHELARRRGEAGSEAAGAQQVDDAMNVDS